ncbi:hypothetical protein ACOME3_001810 [Neoechinorhynchus agilis]
MITPRPARFSIFCGLRPLPNGETQSCCTVISPVCVALHAPNDVTGKKRPKKEILGSFRNVYKPEDSQSHRFKDLCIPLVVGFLQGSSSLLFAYGVSGSGKTYTMVGAESDPGIIPRCLDVIFNSIGDRLNEPYTIVFNSHSGEFIRLTDAERMLERQRREILPSIMNSAKTQPSTTGQGNRIRDPSRFFCAGGMEQSRFTLIVSYVEVYNKNIHDLLDDSAWSHRLEGQFKKALRRDTQGDVFVGECTHVEVRSSDDAYEVFMKGNQRRKLSETMANSGSTRGHGVFTVHLVRLDDPAYNHADKTTVAIISKLCLVDLAGCERQCKAKTTGHRLQEAGHINTSLLVLRKCIEVMRTNQKQCDQKLVVPYRDSKLTMLLKYFFEGHGRTFMLLCMNPSCRDYEENVRALQFAEITQDLENVTASGATIAKHVNIKTKDDPKINGEMAPTSSEDTYSVSQMGNSIIKRMDQNLRAYTKIIDKLQLIESEWKAMSKKVDVFSRRLKEKEKVEAQLATENHVLLNENRNLKTRIDELLVDLDVHKRKQEFVSHEDVTRMCNANDTTATTTTYRTEYIVTPWNLETITHTPKSISRIRGLHYRHRRSSSGHETWINHKPRDIQIKDQILQPRFNRRSKSYDVCSSRMLDDLTGPHAANRYALIHQEKSGRGDLKTEVLKADVYPTTTGGAKVVFKEVESVQSSQSLSRKRALFDSDKETESGDHVLSTITNDPRITKITRYDHNFK